MAKAKEPKWEQVSGSHGPEIVLEHQNCTIHITYWGAQDNPDNVAIICEDHQEILVDWNRR